MKESFAKRMKEGMDIRNIKQVDLVEKTNLTKSAINQYYSGKYEPKQKGIFLIAKALDVSESWLMGYDVPMERTNIKYPDNVLKIETKKFPMLGTIAAGANKVCIDLMMGHKSKEVGERVYTHKTIEELKSAIELITR